jgi:hypothetical protein
LTHNQPNRATLTHCHQCQLTDLLTQARIMATSGAERVQGLAFAQTAQGIAPLRVEVLMTHRT